MKNKKANVVNYIWIIFALIMIVVIISLITNESYQNKYCKNKYPSSIKREFMNPNSYGNTYDISEGYIECCRKYDNNFRKETECKIFKYE